MGYGWIYLVAGFWYGTCEWICLIDYGYIFDMHHDFVLNESLFYLYNVYIGRF